MNRPDHRQVFDTESLQADVMRFMAIIAFCLIAILALVEKLEPIVEPIPASTEQPDPLSQPVLTELKARPETGQQSDLSPTPVQTSTQPEPDVQEPQPNAQSPVGSATPLNLRFVSDSAFITLIGKQRIELYGKIGQAFFKLTPAFSLQPIQLRGDLYEVEALPDSVKAVYSQRGWPEVFLVRLPESTRAQIDELRISHADQGGELLINKNGAVSYETSN